MLKFDESFRFESKILFTIGSGSESGSRKSKCTGFLALLTGQLEAED